MNHPRTLASIALLLILSAVVILLRTTLHGVVVDAAGPLAGAVVRVQGSAQYTITDAQGRFTLSVPFTLESLSVSASAAGYHISAVSASPPSPVTLTLRLHPTQDNPDYTFISPTEDSPGACSRCHAARSGAVASLPVEEWQSDAHAQSAVNPRFLSVYNGTTLNGRRGVPTQYRYDTGLGLDVPVAPSLGQQDAGVGFRLDYPDQAGSCAACHVPVLALDQPHGADPNTAVGTAAEGVTCDFCHKIAGVRLTAQGRPSPHLPGVLSLELLRPAPGEQIFLAQLDDTPGDDVYSPLHDQSAFCAACHSGTFWEVPIYNSFGEWLDSPYSDPVSGQTCQDCHMPPLGVTAFVDLPPDVTQFVPLRDPATIFSHRMPGASDAALLENTAQLAVEARRDGDALWVSVAVTNSGAGHHIPTDNPLRNLILLVEARDAADAPLSLIEGPTIPEWGGVGDPEQGYYAGQPGVLYARLLVDAFTGETPTFAYWRPVRLVSDNRIPALATDTTIYRFALPGDGAITVSARLLLRRAFIDLMTVKGWTTPDMPMEYTTVRVP